MKFIHSADIHLDSPLRGLERYEGAPLDEIRGATRRALENLMQLCVDEPVDLLLIAGDLYDGDWRDYNTGLFFTRQMARLNQANIPVVIIRGNHDAASQLSKSLRLPENVVELSTRKPETRIFEELAIAVHGRGYPQREVTANIVADYPPAVPDYFNIGLLHTALDGRAGHAPYAPCHINDLMNKNYDYWALGHVHQREVIQQNPWIVFSGNLQGRHIRESGAKGASLVTVEDGVISSVEHRALDVVRWVVIEIDLSNVITTDELLSQLQHRLQQCIEANEGYLLAVRLCLFGSSSLHQTLTSASEHWQQQIRALAQDLSGEVWLEKIQFKTRSQIDRELLLNGDDPIASLLRSLQALRDDESELKRLLSEFDALKNKLPMEYRQQDDALDLDDPATLHNLLDDIEQFLLPQLLENDKT